jgi:hypothetical protein
MYVFGFLGDVYAKWTCMPSASEKASAIAIIRIPPSTTSFEWVPECSPTISPRVVITPEVKPKLIPVFKASLIQFTSNPLFLFLWKDFCIIR